MMVMPSIIMPTDIYDDCDNHFYYTVVMESHYAECRYAERRYAEHRYTKRHFEERRYAERRYAERRYADVVILSVILTFCQNLPWFLL